MVGEKDLLSEKTKQTEYVLLRCIFSIALDTQNIYHTGWNYKNKRTILFMDVVVYIMYILCI